RVLAIAYRIAGGERSELLEMLTGRITAYDRDHVRTIDPGGTITTLALAGNGSRFVVGFGTGGMKVWDTSTWDVQQVQRPETSGTGGSGSGSGSAVGNEIARNGRIVATAITHDGRFAAFASEALLSIWDLSTGTRVALTEVRSVQHVTLSNDGQHVLVF